MERVLYNVLTLIANVGQIDGVFLL